jgi:hypothetical protein
MSVTSKPGDTMQSIAQRTLGSSDAWHMLTGYIGPPDKVPPGTVLYLPGESGPAAKPPTPGDPSAAGQNG